MMNFSISWQLILYPISWVLSSLWIYLFFCLIFMRLKLDLINGLYAFYLVNSALFALLQVKLTFFHNVILCTIKKNYVLENES